MSAHLERSQDFSIIEYVQNLLEKNHFTCEIIENGGFKHVIASLKPDASDDSVRSMPRLLFLGHLDTVPFDKSEWGDLDPLTLTEDSTKQVAYGRGAQDCKGSVAALLAAANDLHTTWQDLNDKGFAFSLYLAFTTDEEIGGERGAGYLARLLKDREELPTAVINVDTTFTPTIRRRGAFNVVISAPPTWVWVDPRAIKQRYRVEATRIIQGEHEGPHSAYFVAGCDVHPLITVAKHFFTNPHAWAVRCDGQFLANNIIPARVTVDAFEGPLLQAKSLNTKHDDEDDATSDVETNAFSFQPKDGHVKVNATLTLLLRSVIPAIKAFFPTAKPSSYGINVTPNMLITRENGTVTLILDVRAMLDHTKPLLDTMNAIFADLPRSSIDIKGTPGYLHTNENDPLVQSLLAVLKQQGFAKMPVERGGATDSRYFSPLGIPCVEIGVNGGNVHGPREFVDLNSLDILPSVHVQLITEYLSRITRQTSSRQ